MHQHKDHYSLKSVAVPVLAAAAAAAAVTGVPNVVVDNLLNFVAVLSGVAVAWATTVEFVVVAAAAAAVDNPVNKVAGHLQTHRVDAGAVVVHTAHVVAAAAAAAAAAAVEI